ncbi:MAG TPA: YIP1 family protein [Vicinamibacteria bacterium]|nr:YIP1 family protein [Vicinamibacteria bacterium]
MALCPHCRHAVPDPPVGLCPNCGGDLQAPGLPPEGAASGAGGPGSAPPPLAPFTPPSPGEPGAGPGTAWDQRGRIGFFNALVETTRQVLTGPGAFFRTMPVTGGVGSPLLYAVVIGWVGLAAAAFYQAIFYSVVGSRWAAFGDERPEVAAILAFVQGWGGFVAQLVFGGMFVVIGVFVAAGILHLMLLLLGGATRGFEATFRVVSFAQATSLLLLVPFCGQVVAGLAGLWTLVLYVLGLAPAHRIGHGKAAAAVLLPVLFCCCCLALLGFVFAGAIASLAGRMP